MTLLHFITLTARAPRLELRRAMALALAREVPRAPDAHARFRRRVVEELWPTSRPTAHKTDEQANASVALFVGSR